MGTITRETCKRRIVDAMKKANTYAPCLTIQLDVVAGYLYMYMMTCKDIETYMKENGTLMITEKGRYGSRLVVHPGYKALRDLGAELTKTLKQLKLTVEAVVGSPDIPDNIDAITEELDEIGRKYD